MPDSFSRDLKVLRLARHIHQTLGAIGVVKKDWLVKMENRVIRAIRHYELRPENYTGNFDGILGNVYKGSFEIKCIGERIARKLNEFQFVTGEFDHLYIFLTNKLENGLIVERDFEYDNRMRCFDFGQNRDEYNNLIEIEREKKIIEITFKVLKWKFEQDKIAMDLIKTVEKLIESEGRKLIINYGIKESKDYKISIDFQIAPTDNKSKLIIQYLSKKDNLNRRGSVDLNYYEDIFSLVDRVSTKGQQITIFPKKGLRAEIVTENYSTPLVFNINELEPFDQK